MIRYLLTLGALLALFVALAVAALIPSCAHAADLPADTQVCKPADVRLASDSTAHQNMCWETARVLTQLVRDSGQPCESVVGSIMAPAEKTFFVTCIYHDFSGRADKVVKYFNYLSYNDSPFIPQP